MRILTVGFSDEYAKKFDKELSEYFIHIADNAIDLYDATNFTDFRHYELVIIVDEGINLSIERYINEIKKKKSDTKIIVLTDRYKQQSYFYALGADDVVCNHCEHPDLIAARVLANMRHLFGTRIAIDEFIIDSVNKQIAYGKDMVSLNGKTFDILAFLALRNKKVFSKDEIINALWPEPEYVSNNTVEVAINQIRKRIKSTFGFQVIHTVRRRGYKFAYNQ